MSTDAPAGPIRLTRPPRVELFVRAVTPHGAHKPRNAVVDRLRSAVESGLVESLELTRVGKEARRSPAVEGPEQEMAAIYQRFQKWAASNGCSLAPCFAERSIESGITGESQEVIVFPIMTLVVYDGSGDIAGVVPYRDDGDVYTIHQFLDDLQIGAIWQRTGIEQ